MTITQSIRNTIERFRKADDGPHHALDQIEKHLAVIDEAFREAELRLEDAHRDNHRLNRKIVEKINPAERLQALTDSSWRSLFLDHEFGGHVSRLADTLGTTDQDALKRCVRLTLAIVNRKPEV